MRNSEFKILPVEERAGRQERVADTMAKRSTSGPSNFRGRERYFHSRWSCSLRVAKRGGQSSCWLSEWARIRASVHNWKKWLRSLNPNSRTTRSSRSRFSRRTLVVRFDLCPNLAVEEFSMARRCSHAALRREKIAPPFERPCDVTSYCREGQSEYD